MPLQIDLPFSVKKEDKNEHDLISSAVRSKKCLQEFCEDKYEKFRTHQSEENVLCVEFSMNLTQVCELNEGVPGTDRVYLRRISGSVKANFAEDESNCFPPYTDSIIHSWVDRIFLGKNLAGRELLAEIFRQTAGLMYANSIWDNVERFIENERKKSNNYGPAVVLFNHPVEPCKSLPNETEAVTQLINESGNTFKFLTEKAKKSNIIIVGEYRNFFESDKFIMDVVGENICDRYPFKKIFNNDYLLLNNALSSLQNICTSGWPPIVLPPSVDGDVWPSYFRETYLYSKWLMDEEFYCHEIFGNFDFQSYVDLVSFLHKRGSVRKESTGSGY